jgi:hypothetical protein
MNPLIETKYRADLEEELTRLAPTLGALDHVRVCPAWEAQYYSKLLETRFCKGDYQLTIWENLASEQSRNSYRNQAERKKTSFALLQHFDDFCFLFLSSMCNPPWLCFFGEKNALFNIFLEHELDEAYFVDSLLSRAIIDTHHWELISTAVA